MDNEMIYDFGYRLRQLREDMKLSRAELAKKLGVSKETMDDLILETIHMSSLLLLCKKSSHLTTC